MEDTNGQRGSSGLFHSQSSDLSWLCKITAVEQTVHVGILLVCVSVRGSMCDGKVALNRFKILCDGSNYISSVQAYGIAADASLQRHSDGSRVSGEVGRQGHCLLSVVCRHAHFFVADVCLPTSFPRPSSPQ